VDGTRLSADRLAARLQLRTEALLPKLGVGVEITHKIQAVADLGYLLPLRTRTQLQLDEKSGFFVSRGSAALNLPSSDVSLRVNEQPTNTAPWQLKRYVISLGLLYRIL
jgi:hypothetical protein